MSTITRILLSTLALLLLGGLVRAGESQTSAGGTVGTAPIPTGGGDVATSAAQAQTALEQFANAVTGRTAAVEPTPGDNIYHEVITYNAAQIEALQRSRDANGVANPRGVSINAGPLKLTLGGEVTDIDYPDNFPTAPEIVHFITSEKNQLGSLDAKMQRSAAWLNRHTCGGFDWVAQFGFLFKVEVLKEYMQSLGEGVIAAAPMALLGAFSPQLAEIVKHLKLIAGLDLSSAKADCQAIQGALTSGTQKAMWGDAYSVCLNAQKNNGVTQAVQNCQSATAGSVTNANGTQTGVVTSPAASTNGGWLTNSWSAVQDWFTGANPTGGTQAAGSTAAAAAGTAAANGGATGTHGAIAQGTANASAGGSGPAVNNLLGNGMGSAVNDLAHTLFGSIRLQGTGALEIGRKSYQLFDLKLQAYASVLHDKLEAQLMDHYTFITFTTPDFDVVNDSYKNLKIWTWQSRGAGSNIQPWLNSHINTEAIKLPLDMVTERIDDHTMDCCAYLVALSAQYKDNNPLLYAHYQEYKIEEFISALAQYECYLYTEITMKEKARLLSDQAKQQPATGTSSHEVRDAALAQFTAAMKDLHEGLLTRQNSVLQHLKAINQFRPFAIEAAVSTGTAPAQPWATDPATLQH